MGKKILKPFRGSDALKQKTILSFDVQIPLCNGAVNSSDFIYNANSYDNRIYTSDSFAFALNDSLFSITSKLYDEAAKSLFLPNANLSNIPSDAIDPPTHLSKLIFSTNIGKYTKNMFTMLSFHNPFNVTFDTMSPLAVYFNGYTVGSLFSKFLLFASRVPIFMKVRFTAFC